jgi:hypothetical protein
LIPGTSKEQFWNNLIFGALEGSEAFAGFDIPIKKT